MKIEGTKNKKKQKTWWYELYIQKQMQHTKSKTIKTCSCFPCTADFFKNNQNEKMLQQVITEKMKLYWNNEENLVNGDNSKKNVINHQNCEVLSKQ